MKRNIIIKLLIPHKFVSALGIECRKNAFVKLSVMVGVKHIVESTTSFREAVITKILTERG